MKQILVIDDDDAVLDAFRLALSATPYRVDTADDGAAGLSLFVAGSYALVFLDLRMPRMNGMEVLRRLRAHDPTTPVYVVTAFQAEFLDELRGLRDDGVPFELAAKPLSRDQILGIAHGVLGG
jgi:DNA-binding response OmpR family regulator